MGRTAVFLVALVLTVPAAAMTIRGAGTFNCGTWTSDHSAQPKDLKIAIETAEIEQWVLGYMVGHAAESGLDVLKDVDGSGIKAAMDQECAKTPLSRIDEAADRVILELFARMPHAAKN